LAEIPIIQRLEYDPRKGKLEYLWLEYIESVDLEQHCKRTFIGTTSRKVGTRLISGARNPVIFKHVILNEGDARAFYLCGVSDPYVWRNNVHLAFVADQNSTIEFDSHSIHAVIVGARQIEITRDDIDFNHPKAHDRFFHTCRNWQFAWTFERLRKARKLAKTTTSPSFDLGDFDQDAWKLQAPKGVTFNG
jgi:hypothetical protein